MEITLVIVSILLIISVFLSLIRNDFWIYKTLEYPRLQKLALITLITSCWLFFWPVQNLFYQILLGGLLVSIGYLLYKIFPYTPFSKKEMLKVSSGDIKNEIRIFTANILQENRRYSDLLEQIKISDPDLIFLLETDAAWAEGVEVLKNDYPYSLLAPMENTYGLLFYCRYKLENAKVNFLVKKDLPSIEGTLILPSGEKVKFWGLHPEPPVPTESLYSTAKDKELMKVALSAKDCNLPALVFGDLNDVAWSHTTELFRKTSEMLDPRRGRGFYNTFSAHHWYIRFPLDYIFCSREFGLISMARLPKNGSDHFAMFTHVALKKEIENKQDTPKADKEEMKEAYDLAGQKAPKS